MVGRILPPFHLFRPYRSRIFIFNYLSITHRLIERRRAIDEVDTLLLECGRIEVSLMALPDNIDVRSVFEYVSVGQEFG